MQRRPTRSAHAQARSGGYRCELRAQPCHSPAHTIPRRQLATDDVGERLDEIARIVRGFHASKRLESRRLGLFAPGDVDVAEALEVVGQELYGRNNDPSVARLR